MKDWLVKYVNLCLMGILLLVPLKARAKLLWALFSLKNGLKGLLSRLRKG